MLSNSEPARGSWSPGQSPGHWYRHWSHTLLDLGQKWQTDSGGDLPLEPRPRCCSALMSGTQLNIEKSCFEWRSSWISVTCPFWWKIGHDKCHHKFLNRQYQNQWQNTGSDCLICIFPDPYLYLYFYFAMNAQHLVFVKVNVNVEGAVECDEDARQRAEQV